MRGFAGSRANSSRRAFLLKASKLITKNHLVSRGLIHDIDYFRASPPLLDCRPGRIDANLRIMSALAGGEAFMAARLGRSEVRFLSKALLRRDLTTAELLVHRWIESKDLLWAGKDGWFQDQLHSSTRRADEFLDLYLGAMLETDVLGSWSPGEDLFSDFFPHVGIDSLAALEPWRHPTPWSSSLQGKRVLVIHPFSKSIKTQYETVRENLFEDRNVLPSFTLTTLTPFMEGVRDPDSALDLVAQFDVLRNEMASKVSDVVIIGAGPLGFLLAAEAKRMGRVSIHLGGAAQLLFGIMGKRWEEMKDFGFENEFWIRPRRDETPKGFRAFYDRGAYW